MRSPYRGDIYKAHRLNAARRAAGFSSVRAAAAAFGWSLPTYRAHEGATRAMPEDAARRYAAAFNVAMDWLWNDRGEGPAIDPRRVAKYAAHEKHAADAARNDPAELAFKRLRLARRLAGIWSVKEAAEALGVGRTALSAHETGQNRLSTKTAKFYADAYGVHERWLREGVYPSGYDLQTEAQLEGLIRLHDDSEGEARRLFPTRVKAHNFPGRRDALRQESDQSSPQATGDAVPEIAMEVLRQMLGEGRDLGSLPRERVWWFPQKFLREAWGCEPAAAVVAVCIGSESKAIRPGDRVVIDTNSRTPLRGALYALLDRDGVVIIPSTSADRRILGRACGLMARLETGNGL